MERQEEEEQVRGSEAELRGSKCGDWSGDLCTTTDIAAAGLLLPYITFSSHRCFPQYRQDWSSDLSTATLPEPDIAAAGLLLQYITLSR